MVVGVHEGAAILVHMLVLVWVLVGLLISGGLIVIVAIVLLMTHVGAGVAHHEGGYREILRVVRVVVACQFPDEVHVDNPAPFRAGHPELASRVRIGAVLYFNERCTTAACFRHAQFGTCILADVY